MTNLEQLKERAEYLYNKAKETEAKKDYWENKYLSSYTEWETQTAIYKHQIKLEELKQAYLTAEMKETANLICELEPKMT